MDPGLKYIGSESGPIISKFVDLVHFLNKGDWTGPPRQ